MECKIGEHTYKIGKLGTFDAFEVARKMAFALTGIALIKAEGTSSAKFKQALCALAGNVPSSDVDRATMICLSAVTRQQPGGVGWAPVSSSASGMMFEDIDLDAMLELVWKVLEVNKLPDFFVIAPSTSDGNAGR